MAQAAGDQGYAVGAVRLALVQQPGDHPLPDLRRAAAVAGAGHFGVGVGESSLRQQLRHAARVRHGHAAPHGPVPLPVDDPQRRVPQVVHQEGGRAGLPGGLLPGVHAEDQAPGLLPQAVVAIAAERRRRGEEVGVVGDQVPDRGAAHGGARDADARPVDGMVGGHVLDRLEDVDLAVVLVDGAGTPPRGPQDHAGPARRRGDGGHLLGEGHGPRQVGHGAGADLDEQRAWAPDPYRWRRRHARVEPAVDGGAEVLELAGGGSHRRQPFCVTIWPTSSWPSKGISICRSGRSITRRASGWPSSACSVCGSTGFR